MPVVFVGMAGASSTSSSPLGLPCRRHVLLVSTWNVINTPLYSAVKLSAAIGMEIAIADNKVTSSFFILLFLVVLFTLQNYEKKGRMD